MTPEQEENQLLPLWAARLIVRLQDQAEQLLEAIRKLEAQLPEGMKHCTIVFTECPVGHGQLSATNWVQHDCQICRNLELEQQVKDLKDELAEARER